MNYGMIATGNHDYPDSLRGAPPSRAARIRAAWKLFETCHLFTSKKSTPKGVLFLLVRVFITDLA